MLPAVSDTVPPIALMSVDLPAAVRPEDGGELAGADRDIDVGPDGPTADSDLGVGRATTGSPLGVIGLPARPA